MNFMFIDVDIHEFHYPASMICDGSIFVSEVSRTPHNRNKSLKRTSLYSSYTTVQRKEWLSLQDVSRMWANCTEATAVSYTHLDVYKRQT